MLTLSDVLNFLIVNLPKLPPVLELITPSLPHPHENRCDHRQAPPQTVVHQLFSLNITVNTVIVQPPVEMFPVSTL